MRAGTATLEQLRRQRPRRSALRRSLVVLAVGVVAVWIGGGPLDALFAAPERLPRLRRFLVELLPYPAQQGAVDLSSLRIWFAHTFGADLLPAVAGTLGLAMASIVLAAGFAALSSWAAAVEFTWADPYVRPSRRSADDFARGLLRHALRAVFIFLRGVPVYVWAFLLMGTVGVGVWPAVFALALHNAGILARLYAETLENLPKTVPSQASLSGASRLQLSLRVLLPMVGSRWLVYTFYRAETCIRESTVLGLLGILSLGWFVAEARAGRRFDEVLIWVLVGSSLVVAFDAFSWALRGRLRRSSVEGDTPSVAPGRP